MNRFVPAALFAALLLLFLSASVRPVMAQSAPTATAQLIHNPYMPSMGSPTYTTDILRFHIRVRYHTNNSTSVAPPYPTSEGWSFVKCFAAWDGTYSHIPGIIKQIHIAQPILFGQAETKLKSIPPPPLPGRVITDAVSDYSFGFVDDHGVYGPLPWFLSATCTINFGFQHMHVVNGMVVSDPVLFQIRIPIPINPGSIPVTMTASNQKMPKNLRLVMVPMDIPSPLVLASAGTRFVEYEPKGADDTMTQMLIDAEMSTSVLAAVNSFTDAWFAANPAAQDGSGTTPVTMTWPTNLQY